MRDDLKGYCVVLYSTVPRTYRPAGEARAHYLLYSSSYVGNPSIFMGTLGQFKYFSRARRAREKYLEFYPAPKAPEKLLTRFLAPEAPINYG